MKSEVVPSRSVLCLLENFPHLVNIDSSLMEKFLLSMQNLFHESSGNSSRDVNMENTMTCHVLPSEGLVAPVEGYKLRTLKLCIRKFSDQVSCDWWRAGHNTEL